MADDKLTAEKIANEMVVMIWKYGNQRAAEARKAALEEGMATAAKLCVKVYRDWLKHNREHFDVWEKRPELTGKDYYDHIRQLADKGE